METVSHDGRTTAYRTASDDDPTVCYIHGAGGAHDVWTQQFRSDAPPAVALDLSGHGESDDISADAGTETLDAYADDVVAVCEATGASVLCGNSMGGAVALWSVLERAFEPDGLILADTGAKLSVDPDFLDTISADFEGAVDFLHRPDMLFHEPSDELVDPSRQALLETGQDVTLRDFETCDAYDVRDRVGTVSVPALALCGEHDPLTPPAFHEFLADELPDCSLTIFDDAAHMPMLERPAAFNEAVRSFLD